eukprot:m.164098 g.164098  ORF g.164098 m.164098 type:complete len:161 (+) comp31322_c0_seq1:308-790(+)
MSQALVSTPAPYADDNNAILNKLDGLPFWVCQIVFEFLPTDQLLALSQCKRTWATCAESIFRARCRRQRWNLPRVPRGVFVMVKFPWRLLYLQHSCKGCHARPTHLFPVISHKGCQVALVCKQCVTRDHVVSKMSERGLKLVLESEAGSKLRLSKGKRKR